MQVVLPLPRLVPSAAGGAALHGRAAGVQIPGGAGGEPGAERRPPRARGLGLCAAGHAFVHLRPGESPRRPRRPALGPGRRGLAPRLARGPQTDADNLHEGAAAAVAHERVEHMRRGVWHGSGQACGLLHLRRQSGLRGHGGCGANLPQDVHGAARLQVARRPVGQVRQRVRHRRYGPPGLVRHGRGLRGRGRDATRTDRMHARQRLHLEGGALGRLRQPVRRRQEA
mmetsp:Transcript_76640/g.216863  ORF Transcript_76640/g.216863 Transcript_76640/m.216863 type:complete len:227 (-) Transcript_76640:229-909(-)